MTFRGLAVLACVVVVDATAQSATASLQDSLRSRLEQFAHDSMQGRATGTPGHVRTVALLVNELRRIGVTGAAANGGFVQDVPLVLRQLDLDGARAHDNGQWLPGLDFIPITGGRFGLNTPDSVDVPASVYVDGGRLGARDAISASSAQGKFVIIEAPKRAGGASDYQLWSVRDAISAYRGAAALFVATLDLMPRAFVEALAAPRIELRDRVAALSRAPPIIAVTRGAAQKAIDSKAKGPSYVVKSRTLDAPSQNVVGIIEGSDPALREQYVVLSAAADHLGIADSAARIGADSVYNGANEGGSGSIALLAIAERIAAMPVKPKRSVVFLWTVGTEQGLLGAEYFADRPVVTRASIVANINVGAIGVGEARVTTSGPQLFCDSGDWHFHRWGIPGVNVSAPVTSHSRSVMDDVSRIDFTRYAQSVEMIEAMALQRANESGATVRDTPKPDPRSACVR